MFNKDEQVSVCVVQPLNESYAANAVPSVLSCATLPPRKRKISTDDARNVAARVSSPFAQESHVAIACDMSQPPAAAAAAAALPPQFNQEVQPATAASSSTSSTAAASTSSTAAASAPRARAVRWCTPLVATVRDVPCDDLVPKALFTPYEAVMQSVLEVKRERMLAGLTT